MRAQATLEFMFMFLAAIAFTTLLIGGMAIAKDRAGEQADVLFHTARMEGVARTLDTHSNIGLIMVFGLDNVTYRIEGNSVITDFRNKTIVVEGIEKNEKRIEPI
jgi:hypothetical protein